MKRVRPNRSKFLRRRTINKVKLSKAEFLQERAALATLKSYYLTIASIIVSLIFAILTLNLAHKANDLANLSIKQTAEISKNDHNIDTLHKLVESLQRQDSVMTNLLDSTIRQNNLIEYGNKLDRMQIKNLYSIVALNLHSFNYQSRALITKWHVQMDQIQNTIGYLTTYYLETEEEKKYMEAKDKILFFQKVDSAARSQIENLVVLNDSVVNKWLNVIVGIEGSFREIDKINRREERGQIIKSESIRRISLEVENAFPRILDRLKKLLFENDNIFSDTLYFIRQIEIEVMKSIKDIY